MKFDTSVSRDFTSIAELAALWCCTPAHIHRLIKRGQLPAYRIGGRIIISRGAAQKFLEQGATAHTPEAA